MSKKSEKVNHPDHYNKGKFEVIDVIDDWFDGLDFCAGNAIKYIARYKHKEDPLHDLKKARWYIERMIDQIEENKEEKK